MRPNGISAATPICLVLLGTIIDAGNALEAQEFPSALAFRYARVTGIGEETGVCRRDPSDVIKVGDSHYVYYTKVVRDELPPARAPLYPSGYPGTVWYAVSQDDGRTWVERGEALACGEPGEFDSFGVFTPNILCHEGRYWLYYTGVQPTAGKEGVFENNSTTDPTAIGVAVGDSPDGPFHRAGENPVLKVGSQRDAFDSYRVDDACLVVRSGRIWLYYKGRSMVHGSAGPARTQMGVAVSDHPQGPFIRRHGGQSVQDSGHEVQVFAYRNAVVSLVSPTGPNGRTLQFADNGVDFRVVIRGLSKMPKAPGMSRPELTNSEMADTLPKWGVSMGTYSGDPFLMRFECIWGNR